MELMEPGQGKGSSPPPLSSASESSDQVTERKTGEESRGKLERSRCGLLRTEPTLTLRGN